MTPSQFFLFQVGPVQDFIAQARSTRDLWSGSYLISWLVAHALKTTEEKSGTVVFPATENQPLLRWLKDPENRNKLALEQVLTPSLPNRFFAEVPANFDADMAEKVKDAFIEEWQKISDECWKWLHERLPFQDADAENRWKFQIKNHWQISWQLWPKHEWKTAEAQWLALPKNTESHALDGTEEDKAWVANYELICHRFDARRQLREFTAWAGVNESRYCDKDAFSGKEDAFNRRWGSLDSKDWFELAASGREPLRHLFRSQEPLAALNLIKRVWHLAYLAPEHQLDRNRIALAFDSVPAIAAAAWRDSVLAAATDETTRDAVSQAIEGFEKQVDAAREFLPFSVRENRTRDLRSLDGSIFHESTWHQQEREYDKNEPALDALRAGLTALKSLRSAAGVSAAPGYYAVLAMDGDNMGKWISGEITGQAKHGFHQKFSAELSKFGIEDARSIVEKYLGTLIYSGGDDVLAMLPAANAIECAQKLSDAFRERIRSIDANLPKATVSVGIAIGHMKEPLQDMVQAAGDAEQRAKGKPLQKDAVAVTVFKRSGETLEWGAKFGSKAFSILDIMRKHYRKKIAQSQGQPPITGRFPHRIAAALQPFQSYEQSSDGFPDRTRPNALDASFIPVVCAELDHVIERQARELPTDVATSLRDDAKAYLEEIARMNPPLRTTDEIESKKASLRDFYQLFLVEAFLQRQQGA